jgi:hypothetical protein
MADGKLNNLLAALREVAADTPDPNDDDSDWNEDDPAADGDTDPLDDSGSYYPDATDTEDAEDQDQESDFRRRAPIGTVMLLQRLEERADFKADQKDRALAARRLRTKGALTKLEQKSAKLMEMRRKTAAAEHELNLNQKLKLETKRLQKVRLELYKENLTATDRMELETDAANMADWASQYCKEAASNWREDARATFGCQYQPPVNGRSPKNS